MKFGMFHQLRVDEGNKFNQILGMQELFSDLRNHQDIAAYRQTKSKMVCFLVIFLLLSNNSFGTKMLICDAFCDLVPFVQREKFEKREKYPWRSVKFTKANTTP